MVDTLVAAETDAVAECTVSDMEDMLPALKVLGNPPIDQVLERF